MPMAITGGTIMTTSRDRTNTSQPAVVASVETMAYSPPALGMRVPSSE